MRALLPFAVAGLVAALVAQEQQTPRFRVAVDAVRIDAVVTDRDGNVVSDLTADDFEIFQDGKKQKVTFAQFVPVSVGPAATKQEAAVARLKASSVVGAPPPPSAAVRRENIQRTIALVVDDLSLSVESLYYAKRGLHDFIDRAMQPGDLVALVRTGGSLDGLQPFTTDRRVLHAAVDNLKWNAFSRNGVESFPAVNQSGIVDDHATSDPSDFTALEAFRGMTKAAGTLGALNLVVQGAKNLPGRKAVLFVTEGFVMIQKEGGGRSVDNPAGVGLVSPDPRIRDLLDRVIDQATRAGVVIYSIDARGLQTGGLQASDNLAAPTPGAEDPSSLGVLTQTIRQKQGERSDLLRNTQEGMAYLAEQTGGFAVLNNNDLGAAMTRASQDVRDYYIIGYAPDTKTFARKGAPPQYHKLTVRVKRPGVKIRTRREFLGVSDVDESAAPETPAQQLVNAAISPFTSTEIVLRSTLLPGFDDRGQFLRALLHIDASALTFTKGADDRAAAVDVLGMVFDRDGTEVAHLSTGFSAALTEDATEDARRDGLAYSLRIPIPRAGPYQVRFAVRDRASGKYGSVGEFVDLPDVSHGVFAVSGIVLRSSGDVATPSSANSLVISPSQAIRAYKPGAEIKYACEIYNPAGPVQVALSLWRGTERVLVMPPTTLAPPVRDKTFAVGGAFKLGESLPAGRYVLQIAAETRVAGERGPARRALQEMDFDVK